MDVHEAGCQRNDQKNGDINYYPQFFDPQGDARYVYNFVRCVRDLITVNKVNDLEKQQLN